MKRCPACQRTYTDDTMKFCLEDGTPLLDQYATARDTDATLFGPTAPPRENEARTEVLRPQSAPNVPAQPTIPVQPQGAHQQVSYGPMPGAQPGRRSVLPWVLLAGAVILGLSAVITAYLLTRSRQPENVLTAQTETASPTPAATTASATPPQPPASPADTGQQAASASPAQPASSPSPRPSPDRASERASPSPPPRPSPTAQPAPPLNDRGEAISTPARRGPVSGGVLNGKAISLPRPAYPPMARAARASGTVVVQVLVDENGNVLSARAVSGHPLLQASAVNAARQAKFSPTRLSGEAVKVTGVITYNFALQ